jgi:hypothetical protein
VTGPDTNIPWPGRYLESDAAGLLELGISMLREPLLSSAAVKGWPGRGATMTRDTLDTCALSYTTSADSVWTYTIDKSSWLISRLVVHSKSLDSNVFDGTYFYGDSNGIPVIEKIALMRDTTMHHGGYVFSNIRLNESIPDSVFKSGVMFRAAALTRKEFSITRGIRSVAIDMPRGAGIKNVSVYNSFGKEIKKLTVDNVSARCEWRYGNSVSSGLYIVRAVGNSMVYSGKVFIAH